MGFQLSLLITSNSHDTLSVLLHVATPAIFSGKWGYTTTKARGVEHNENTSEQPKTSPAVSRNRYPAVYSSTATYTATPTITNKKYDTR
jgi:hypothetical protein